MAAVALHEFAFARDLLGVRVRFLRRALVALRALAVVGGVVAAERGQLPVAQLPDARHGRVEECPVVRCHEQRARPALEVDLEPLERVDVEVVRRLVEQEQVGVGDHETGQRGPRLLAAGHCRRRLRPLAAREAEPRQGRIDAQVQRVPAQRIEAVLELGVGRLAGPAGMLQGRELGGHHVEMRGARADGGAQVRSGHERGVEVRFLREEPE